MLQPRAYNAFMSQQGVPLSERASQVEVSDGEPCGRTMYFKQTVEESDYVCLMHSHDRHKNSDAFEKELELICNGTSVYNRTKNKRDYQGFVFFKSEFSVISLAGVENNFAKAAFVSHADFSQSLFDRDVDFTGASFITSPRFEQTRFQRRPSLALSS